MWNGSVQDRKIKCLNRSCFTDSQANDDSKFVEFLSIHILLTPECLVFILQYFSCPVFMTVSILVNKLGNSFLEPAMKLCFAGDLCSLGVQYRCGNLLSSSDSSIRRDFMKVSWVLTMSSDGI